MSEVKYFNEVVQAACTRCCVYEHMHTDRQTDRQTDWLVLRVEEFIFRLRRSYFCLWARDKESVHFHTRAFWVFEKVE